MYMYKKVNNVWYEHVIKSWHFHNCNASTVQLMFKLTLACGEHVCVLQFYRVLCQNTRVTWNGLHANQLLCTAHELFFMLCMRMIICVMHDSKKHTSNASCVPRGSVSLRAACKLTAIFWQRRIKAYNKKATSKTWYNAWIQWK